MSTLVCITGGAGYIGRCLVSHLLSKGVARTDVSVVDNMSSRTSRMLPAGVQFRQADICDTNAMRAWLADRKPRVVVNLAGLADVLDSEHRVDDYMRTNVVGVQSVVTAMNDMLPTFRFIQASSCAVYGPYSSDQAPKSWYGKTKLFAEEYLRHIVNSGLLHSDCVSVLALRLFNVYGVYVPAFSGEVTPTVVGKIGIGDPDIASTRLMQRMAVSASAAKVEVEIRTDFTRDYVHIEDVCCALYKAVVAAEMNVEVLPYRAIDIGTGIGRTPHWIASHWLRYANATPTYRVLPNMAINDAIRSPEAPVAIARTAEAKAELKWQAKIPLGRGIRTLQMYMNHVVRNGGKQ